MEVDVPEDPPNSPQNNFHPPPATFPEISDDDDPYKPEGKVMLKIEKLSEFAREDGNSRRLSESVYIRGLPWKILAIPRELGRRTQNGFAQKCLGYFLQCNADNNDSNWSCAGSATLRIISQKDGKEDHARKISHVFHSKENDWGFAQFMTFEALMDSDSGWYDEENDTVVLAVEVTADAPHGVNWDSKKDTGYIGLKNQGATCYMNSILQTLFFTNKLRKAVYQMPTEEDNPESSVALAMQRVLYELQFFDSPVGTKKLTKSFGWDSIDSFLQHDVQEFCRVLLDNLESKMRNTKVADTIPSLFKGCMKSYIKCKNVDFGSSREECFYDLQLNVKGKSNVLESFRDYIEMENLDGENKYDAGDFGLQPAEKGLKFLSFPPVLHLQLMRFQYDPMLDSNVKINDRYEFSESMELNEFAEPEAGEAVEKDEYTYLLYAVLVHSGDFHGGHYVAFINTNLKGSPRWCKFDDDVVSRVTARDAVTANFGGENPEGVGRSFTNAYMLVYIKKSAIGEVLCTVSEEDIPEHLKVRFENERKREVERRLEREEANNYCEITLILDEEMKAHHEFELFDGRMTEVQTRKLKVQKSMSYMDLYKFIAKNMSMKEGDFRLWDFQESDNNQREMLHRFRVENSRPRFFMDPLETYDEYDESESEANSSFLPTTKTMTFWHSSNSSIQTDFSPTINKVIGQPADAKLNLYMEIRPDKIIPLQQTTNTLKNSQFMQQDGVIIIAELAEQINEEPNVVSYFKTLFNRIEVEAHVLEFGLSGNNGEQPAVSPVRGQIGLDWKLSRVCSWLGAELDYDPAKIMLYKNVLHSEKPSVWITHQHLMEMQVSHMLGFSTNSYDPRYQRVYNHTHVLLHLMNDKFHLTEMSIFVEKNASVQTLLDEARKEFKFADHGTNVLRLVHASADGTFRVYQVLKNDMLYRDIQSRSSVMLRIEEVPKDQLEVGQDEYLMPVAHFDREPNRTFGVPFFIKISSGEKVSSIRERIREMLDVPDKEFEKYKFCIVRQGRVTREFDNQDDSASVNLSELTLTHITYPQSAPFLGIQHPNRIRATRGVLDSKKAIVIHN
uniref:Ubiquitin carboxyl-terminal hydrolase 7 n=1 Tax=Globodera rostochiensis TaxID=31243 RepID=A0A914H2D2_GLORO